MKKHTALFLGLLSVCLVGTSALAERGYIAYPEAYPAYNYYNDDQVKVFDDKVFNIGKSPVPRDSDGRNIDYNLSYSLKQRNRWIKGCEYLKKADDYEKFKKCFQDKVAANEAAIDAAGDPYGGR